MTTTQQPELPALPFPDGWVNEHGVFVQGPAVPSDLQSLIYSWKPVHSHHALIKFAQAAVLADRERRIQEGSTLVQQTPPFAVDSRCNYIANTGHVCGKCRRIHDGKRNPSHFQHPGANQMGNPPGVLPAGFIWPDPPKGGQSDVLFDAGYEEGWAKCIDTLKTMIAAAPSKVEDKP